MVTRGLVEHENFNIGITFIGNLTKLILYICVYVGMNLIQTLEL